MLKNQESSGTEFQRYGGPQLPQQKEKPHGKKNNLTMQQKEKDLRQKEKPHGKKKKTQSKKKTSWQNFFDTERTF